VGREGAGCLIAGVVVAVLGIFGTVIYFATSTANVDAGHVGVVTHWGVLDTNVLGPGFHTINPFGDRVTIINVQATTHVFQEAGATTQEQTNVYFDGKVVYNVDQRNAITLYRKVGVNFESKIFDPAFQDFIREESVKYSATVIQSKRAEIRDAVLKRMQAQASTYGIDVQSIFITGPIHFDKSYEDAIKAKSIAQQQLAQTTIEADQARAKAQGEADANRIRQSAITDQTLKQKELDNQAAMIARWDGHQSQIQGATPIIQLPVSK
jgi:prohibitin 2